MAALTAQDLEVEGPSVARRISGYPRIRFMGSKYKLASTIADLFETLPRGPALDAFSGSGVVGYALKASGRRVVCNDHLEFAAALARATVENESEQLTFKDLELLRSGNCDGRNFIARTFENLYFPLADHQFLDAIWSQLGALTTSKRAITIASLCLAAAWKQPRGVFTITTPRYDDGRRQLRMSLEELFLEAVSSFNGAVFEGATPGSRSVCGDVFDIDPGEFAVAYFDPPYAPPRDDTCYIKRYHFLEGLATYWSGQEIMWETRSRKIRKRHTPFAYKRTAGQALDKLFDHFRRSALVVSYGSNAAIGVEDLEQMLRRHKRSVQRIEISHRYGFGTHSNAERRLATEYLLVGT